MSESDNNFWRLRARYSAAKRLRKHGRESEIQGEILRAYANHPRVRLWRQNTGAVRIGNRFVRFGLKGQADATGVIAPEGRALFIEVKAPGGKQTPEQKAFEKMVTSMGAVYILACSVDDVKRVLGC